MQKVNRQRFELLIAGFLEEMRVRGWSRRSLDSYRSHLGSFLTWLDSGTDVEEIAAITPEILHTYQTHLYTWSDEEGRGLSIATQAARLSAVRSLFRHLVQSDVLLYDPAGSVTLPKRKGILPRSVLTKQEVARLLAAPDPATCQ